VFAPPVPVPPVLVVPASPPVLAPAEPPLELPPVPLESPSSSFSELPPHAAKLAATARAAATVATRSPVRLIGKERV
jgi:hypothetical protein